MSKHERCRVENWESGRVEIKVLFFNRSERVRENRDEGWLAQMSFYTCAREMIADLGIGFCKKRD